MTEEKVVVPEGWTYELTVAVDTPSEKPKSRVVPHSAVVITPDENGNPRWEVRFEIDGARADPETVVITWHPVRGER